MEKFAIECKKLMVEEIKEKLQSAPDFFFSSFNAMPVSEQEELRGRLKEIDVALFVVKNRLARQAFQQLNLEHLCSMLLGLTAITAGETDVITISKILVNFAAKHPNFKISGAYVDKQILDVGSLKKLASIQSREMLLAQVIYSINSPIQGLVNTLQATIKKFVWLIEKIRENKEQT